ncbi:MAG: hypothetical protein H7240_05415, partial [Glaciimonas sp.]|nr:hypothetical protein [Glaciimonas sp.]
MYIVLIFRTAQHCHDAGTSLYQDDFLGIGGRDRDGDRAVDRSPELAVTITEATFFGSISGQNFTFC